MLNKLSKVGAKVDLNINFFFRNHLPSVSDLKVDVKGHNKYQRECRIWTNILDRKDGSFIVRYKLYETCYNMKIYVRYKDHDIGDSPYQITGRLVFSNSNLIYETKYLFS